MADEQEPRTGAAPTGSRIERLAFTSSLRFRFGVPLAILLTAAVSLFAILLGLHARDEYLAQTIAQNQQLAEVIRRSTRFAMLQNHREQVARITEAVSRTHGIEKIRILSKDGEIITSTLLAEVGTRVDKTAEACYSCHAAGKPLTQIPGPDRHRIYRSPVGHRVLGTIDVIRNEPACSTAECHAHPPEVTVLGVLDIAYSLVELDARRRRDVLIVAGFSAGLVVVIFLAVTLLVQVLVYAPLEDLEEGARLVSSGDREHVIPVRRADEIGHLAASFNKMTVDLKRYEHDLEVWAHTLEGKVEQKTGELRLAEAKALHAEKLASVGLLAAGIAHEINNPLTGVLTFAHLVRAKVPDGSPEAEDMDVIIRETKRCATIIRRLLDFAREKKPDMAHADLNLAIRETLQLVEHQAGFQDIALVEEYDPALPPVWMDASQMKQVFMNFVVNAKDAMEGHGTFRVRTRLLPGTGPRRVEATFEDSGCGIPPENLQRIFDPFFTSKEPGRGVGLGLSVGYNIVKTHGGTIEVESEVGRGTTFRIILPVEGKPQAAAGERHAG